MDKERTRASGQEVQSKKNRQAVRAEIEYTQGVEMRIILVVIFLLAFGLIMIYSASSFMCSISSDYNFDSAYFLKKQIKAIILSVAFATVAYAIPFYLYKKFAIFFFVVAFGLNFLLFTPLAVESHGAPRWIQIGGTQIQLADIWRICLLIFMAYYIHKFKDVIKKKDLRGGVAIIILWGLMGFQAICLEKISSNLSTALILLIICFFLTWVISRNTIPHVFALVIGIIGLVCIISYLKSHMPSVTEIEELKYQVRRLYAWMDPKKYSNSYGYQTLQSLYAIGSGGLWGKGLGNGTQKLSNLPEGHNDMIFSVICEEMGLIGAIILFTMYGYLLYQMYIIVKESRNMYACAFVLGVMLHLITQIVVNVCVTVNLFPNTGVTLPFISYGGTATLSTLAEIGMVLGIRRKLVKGPSPKKKKKTYKRKEA